MTASSFAALPTLTIAHNLGIMTPRLHASSKTLFLLIPIWTETPIEQRDLQLPFDGNFSGNT